MSRPRSVDDPCEEPTTSTENSRVRAAIVGTGAIAGSHLSAFQTFADRVELVAAVDVDSTRLDAFRQRSGEIPNHGEIQGYLELDRMLREQQPDLVSICTPPALHAEQTIAVLRAGSWVWCEKPPCPSLAEYDSITAAESDGGPYASFVFQQRFGSAATHARNLLRSGRLGAPLIAHCQTTWYRNAAYYAVPWRGKWETEGGGPAMGHGIHQMDLLLHLLGPWSEVQAMTGRLVHDVETEDVSTALVRFDSGAMATVVNSVLSPQEVSRIRVDCADATVELTHLYGYTNNDWVYTAAPHVDEAQVTEWQATDGQEPSSHTEQLRQLLSAMRAGERPGCSGDDGRRSLEFIAALYKAALTGTTVRAGEIRPGDAFYTAMHGGMADKIVISRKEVDA